MSTNIRGRTVFTVLSIVARFGLALVWLVSGYQKMANPMGFRQSIQAYELFSPGLVEVIALTLPPVEIVLGLFLLCGLFLRPAAMVTAVIMVGFIAGISSAAIRGLEIDCGCFSSGSGESGSLGWAIARDVLFLAMAVWAVKFPFRKLALHP
ncbi:DoxX family membrane protein [Corynebacterium hindlerae]|uniref:DoxX family membrane protein n=1 Tax=Corynebacterium hindlerae TaxID=699041 RepID=A0A7G5FDI3_9CORY|nr:DoxX family membrane protein [Corynebacterium hindlerae]